MTERDSAPTAREAVKSELRRRLGSAPADWLAGVLDNPETGPRELMLLLRNSAAPAELLERIGNDRRWTSHHELRRGLARHARTPAGVSRNLLPHLFWKDWLDIAAQPAANPVVRRQAERLLLGRLAELGEGELIAVARRAPRGVIGALLERTEPHVVEALLDNPRLVELDAVRLASNTGSGAEALARIARHGAWGARRAVRLELVRRPELAVQTALKLAREIDPRDLRVLVEDDRVPLVVRVGMERRLSALASGRGEWS